MIKKSLFFVLLPLCLHAAVVTNTDDSGAGSLREAMTNAVEGESITFSVSGTITLASPLPEMTVASVTINGTGQSITISGASTYRPFFISATGITLSNMTISSCKALGGRGGGNGGFGKRGGGAGGAGLGGAIFVNDTGSATVSAITFSSNTAAGGNSSVGMDGLFNGAGGGGLGGDGGNNDFTFTGSGGGGKFPTDVGAVGTALSPGSGGGPIVGPRNTGGEGGEASATESLRNGQDGLEFGGGGGGGSDEVTEVNSGNGGNGGFGGGGGGGAVVLVNPATMPLSGGNGGNGGFGGGGGGGSSTSQQSGGVTGVGGTAGLGGGNGGDSFAYPTGQLSGSNGGGGGGLGAGGNIFVRSGGSISVDSNLTAGTVTGGSGSEGSKGGGSGANGQAKGSGIFLNGNTTLTVGGSGVNYEISGAIEDDQSLTQGSGTKGNGALTKTGTNTVTLSGTNTYTGATAITGGTLNVTGSIGSSSSLTMSGNGNLITTSTSKIPTTKTVNSGSTLTLNLSTNETVSAALFSGAGNLVKSGSGTLTLSGTNAYTGSTTVSAGTLSVTGSISSATTITVSSGATLKGNGSVGSIVIEGTMDPGTSIGTMTILGNYTQSSGSTLDVEFNTYGDVSLLDITGTATIASNTTLNLVPQAGRRYDENITYTFIDADGGLTGTFSNITLDNSNLGIAKVFVNYTANQAQFYVVGEPPSGPEVALISLTASLASRANRIQLGILTEVQNQRLTEEFYCGNRFIEHDEDPYEFVQRNREKVGRLSESKTRKIYHPFVMVDYSKARINETPLQTGGHDWLKAVTAGCDFYLLKEFILGFGAGYTRGSSTSDQNHGRLYSNNYNLGFYLQSQLPLGFIIDAACSGMKTYYELKRESIEGLTIAKPHGYEFASEVRFLAQHRLGHFRYRPFISFDYYNQQVGNYSERRGIEDRVLVGKDHFYSFEMGLGLNIWYPFWLGRNEDWNFVPNLGFSFIQVLAANKHSVDAEFAHSPFRTSHSSMPKVAKDAWTFEAGFASFFRECSEIFFTYQGVFTENYSAHQEYRLGTRLSF